MNAPYFADFKVTICRNATGTIMHIICTNELLYSFVIAKSFDISQFFKKEILKYLVVFSRALFPLWNPAFSSVLYTVVYYFEDLREKFYTKCKMEQARLWICYRKAAIQLSRPPMELITFFIEVTVTRSSYILLFSKISLLKTHFKIPLLVY